MKLKVYDNITDTFSQSFLDQSVEEKELEKFISEFKILYARINSKESEENQKNIISDFLKDVYYKSKYEINTKGRIDLVIHNGKSAQDKVGVIIEAKRPVNKSEMVTVEKPNVKAFQEILLYYLDERVKAGNLEVKYLIITNITDWYIIDAQEFEKIITTEIKNSYSKFKDGTLLSENNNVFYNEIAKNFFDKCEGNLPCVKVNLEIINKLISNTDEKSIDALSNYYKLFSPHHLLKRTFNNDSNKLNDGFYNELLHIIGLKETKDSSKKIIERKPENERNLGSLLENTITILKSRNKLHNISNLEQYGVTEDDQLFSVALELCITWLNRILFLKLLEGQLIKYNNNNREQFEFLNSEKIKDYDELDELFFEVLAVKNEQRPKEILQKFGNIPYLNSSLFEPTELEQKVLEIHGIKDRYELEIFKDSVLKNDHKRKTGSMLTLNYLFDFLNAYDFASDKTKKIQVERKTIINASVLGLIFEKINGYKDGSFYTPGFITEYMCSETIRKAVIQKFNETKKWVCTDWSELQRQVSKIDIKEANDIVNSIKICDPSVGSGHFLVSALNEMIVIKFDLEIFADEKYKQFRGLTIKIENDELIVRLNSDLFNYNFLDENSQRLQETLFKEKRAVIENCLFGVDINPKSVMICQLRLWIELLKNAYYTQDNNSKPNNKELQTLPNIDINIKCGNSLISRFKVKDDIFEHSDKFKRKFNDYKNWVDLYKSVSDKKSKQELRKKINEFIVEFRNVEQSDLKSKQKEIDDKSYKLYNTYNTQQLFDNELTPKQQQQKDKLEAELNKLIEEKKGLQNNPMYNNALEWRFEFPEILSESGNFIGFDVIIGNPPYVQLQKMGTETDGFEKMNFETFARTGDIYSLFYELGYRVLKEDGVLTFITSNKWMRAGYGENTRKFFAEKTNPVLLIDFAGQKIFDEATVDTNILMFTKQQNQQKTHACIIKENMLNNLSVFVRQEGAFCSFINKDSWIILSDIESRIKQKVERIGTPLKDWDIQINYGIKTGFNEAFIITGETRKELIDKDPKSEEIIRPILRGRDIKRYGYEFANLYLISTFPSLKIDIEKYPAVKEYLLGFDYNRLKQTGEPGARKKTNNKWFETQDSISYWEDFFIQKIMYPNMTKFLPFYLDDKGFVQNDKSFMITGKHLAYLTAFLNSSIFKYCFIDNFPELQGGTRELRKIFLDKISVLQISDDTNKTFEKLVLQLQELTTKQLPTKEIELKIDEMIFELYLLTPDERNIIGFIEIQ